MAKTKRTKKPKKRKKPAWASIVPGGKVLPTMSLDELRNVKAVHELLTEKIPGPPVVGYTTRSFRFLKMYAIACIVENKHPALTRCWKELERLFMRDPALRDEFFVSSWILLNFPCGPDQQTLLDHFERFIREGNHQEQFAQFIQAVRPTRLGLYQEVLRSGSSVRYRELVTGRVVEAHPSLESGGSGEIVLGRLIELEGQKYFFGDAKAFPADARETIENMVIDKLFYVDEEASTPDGLYEAFMRLAGPYWMSIVAKNDNLPILNPDHYVSYLQAD